MGKVYINEKQIIIRKMIKIYETVKIDWMSYLITERNYLTFHHIRPVSENGKIALENGALLTKNAHRDLNKLEAMDSLLFIDWNELFTEINKSKEPLDEYFLEQSRILKSHTKKLLHKK